MQSRSAKGASVKRRRHNQQLSSSFRANGLANEVTDGMNNKTEMKSATIEKKIERGRSEFVSCARRLKWKFQSGYVRVFGAD